MAENISVEVLAARLTDHLKSCEDNARAYNAKLDSVVKEIDGFKRIPMQAAVWIGGIVVTAALTMLTQNFFLHEETFRKADAAATQAAAAAVAVQQIPEQTAAAVSATLPQPGAPTGAHHHGQR